jgi:uncharacterized protein
MLTALISALLQIGLVLLIAAGAWLATRRREPFRAFVGLTTAPWTAVAAGLVAGVVLAFLLTRLPAVQTVGAGERSVVGETSGGTMSAGIAVALAIKALLQTSLSEELLFRGLIGRNLIRRLGFATGNMIQAMLFGLAHLLLLLAPGATAALVLLVVLFTGGAGWAMGWLNHRKAGGSILPGWAAHGGGNLTAYLLLAFGV